MLKKRHRSLYLGNKYWTLFSCELLCYFQCQKVGQADDAATEKKHV